MTLPREGYRSRVSDLLNAWERSFISVTDATVRPHDGGESTRHGFLALARSHVVFAVGIRVSSRTDAASEQRDRRTLGAQGRGAVSSRPGATARSG